MLDELRKNAAGDKEFIVNELKKKIAELEQKIEEMHRSFAKERDEMVSLQKKMQSDFELKMQELQRDHKTVLATMTADHRAEIDRLNESAERKVELLRQEMTMSKQKALDEMAAKH